MSLLFGANSQNPKETPILFSESTDKSNTADVNSHDLPQSSSFVRKGKKPSTVGLLLSNGADINVRGSTDINARRKNDHTLLSITCDENDGAIIDAKNNASFAPLHVACSNYYLEIIPPRSRSIS